MTSDNPLPPATERTNAERPAAGPYALFVAVPLIGHLNPLIRQAQELLARGVRVGIASSQEMAGHVEPEAPGVPFVDLGPLGDAAAQLRRNEERASADRSLVRGSFRIVEGLLATWPVLCSVARRRPSFLPACRRRCG